MGESATSLKLLLVMCDYVKCVDVGLCVNYLMI
jgi:hypothetical protein